MLLNRKDIIIIVLLIAIFICLLFGRLSEGNMSVISSEIENLFIHNSRNGMSDK